MKLILPKTLVEREKIEHPLFFLAGPVRGGGNWQEKCCEEIAKLLPEFFAVVPCRWQPADKLFCYRVEGIEHEFPSQTAWESYYLGLISELSSFHEGCIIFWLPVESKEHPRDDGQPYARDTLGELGRWGRNAVFTGAHLAVGAEPDFPGLKSIKENFRLDLGDEFQIYVTIEETVKQAVKWVDV